jgi:hypothetical protein
VTCQIIREQEMPWSNGDVGIRKVTLRAFKLEDDKPIWIRVIFTADGMGWDFTVFPVGEEPDAVIVSFLHNIVSPFLNVFPVLCLILY